MGNSFTREIDRGLRPRGPGLWSKAAAAALLAAALLLPGSRARASEFEIAADSFTIDHQVNLSSVSYFNAQSTAAAPAGATTGMTAPGGLFFNGLSYMVWDNNANAWVALATGTVPAGAGAWTLNGSNLFPSLLSANVGIGTSSPAYALDVDGGAMLRSSATWAGMATPPPASAGGSGAIYFDSGLHQFMVSQNGGAYFPLGGAQTAGGWTEGAGLVQLSTPTDSVLVQSSMAVAGNFFSVGDSTFVVTGGLVGIGTTSPNARLDIEGTDAVLMSSGIATTAGNAGLFVSTSVFLPGTSTMTAGYFVGDGSGLTNLPGGAWTEGGGLVSLSTPTDSVLVQSTMAVAGNFFSVGSSTFVVTGGNVGIGTTSPATALDVHGGAVLRSSATWVGVTAPSTSAAGSGAIYFDSALHQFMVSQNAGSYYPLSVQSGGGSGTTSANAGRTCQTIATNGFSTGSHAYWIAPDGVPANAFQAYCDMDNQGGGWTLVVGIDGANSNQDDSGAVTPGNLTSPTGKGKFSDATINLILVGANPGYRFTCGSVTGYFSASCVFSATTAAAGACAAESYTYPPAPYGTTMFSQGQPGLADGDNSTNDRLLYGGNVGCDTVSGWNQSGAVYVGGTGQLTAPAMSAVAAYLPSTQTFTGQNTFTSSAAFAFSDASAPGVTISSGLVVAAGAVGIGTTSPTSALTVLNGSIQISSTSGGPYGLVFEDGSVQTTAASGGGWTEGAGMVQLSTPTDSVLVQSTMAVAGNFFSVGGSTLVVTGGRVGVGTTSPTSALTVFNGDIAISTSSGSNGIIFQDGSKQTTAAGASSWAAYGGDIANANSGSVGIGTTAPAATLHVSSAAASGTTLLMEVSSGTGASQQLLVVQANGNVGIGVTNPVAPFQVGSGIGGSGACSGSGGTLTQSGGNCIHTFTSGTNVPFTYTGTVGVLVVAGGGGGASNLGGGGGGGGVIYNPSYSMSGTVYVTIGAGGSGAPDSMYATGTDGADSLFGALDAAGGGGGRDVRSGRINRRFRGRRRGNNFERRNRNSRT